jgi:hypothetical protein
VEPISSRDPNSPVYQNAAVKFIMNIINGEIDDAEEAI